LLKLPLPTMLIGIITVAIGVAILIVALGGTRAGELLATPARAPAPLAFDVSDAPRGADLGSIQSQPLVHASRSFFVPPPPGAAPTSPPRPDYRLAGVLVVPHKPAVALLVSRQGGASRRVKQGDELEGWRVQTVDRKQVTLAYQTETFDISAAAAPLPTNAGLKRVPMNRARMASAGGGVQSLGATGTSSSNFSTGPSSDQPRLYRPPPQ
jgi:hypothetical protein